MIPRAQLEAERRLFAGLLPPKVVLPHEARRPKLDHDKMCRLRESGMPAEVIGNLLGCSTGTVLTMSSPRKRGRR